ncbi:MAG: TPM domain-containing protein, partial [Nitrospirae bacterium]|nr:TPM domain-containing protein [Nitrospirota bacterium]
MMRRGRISGAGVALAATSLAVALVGADGALAATSFDVVPFRNYITDEAQVVPDPLEQELNALLRRLQERTGAQIAVVTVKTTGGIPAADYAVEFGHRWGVGSKEKDNGVVFLTAVDDREMFIATGYGVEGILPDGKVGRIRDEEVIPSFRNGDVAGGIAGGTLALAREIAAAEGIALEELGAASPRAQSGRRRPPQLPIMGILPFLLLFVVLPLLFRRRRRFGFFPPLLLGGGMRGPWFGGGFSGGGFGGGFG